VRRRVGGNCRSLSYALSKNVSRGGDGVKRSQGLKASSVP
jgi:hypothetical protein